MKVNETVRLIRLSKGFTQKQVADRLKIPVQTYNGYELGRRKIHVELLQEIAAVLDEPIQKFFSEKIYKSKKKEHSVYV
ncbi:MAG TPA: helix-turn-helix transcriptional regulator [Bacillus sp. (in: firmicutes)]|uniref:helix-turn-helix transcriptional regulator n=1 Tax=Bacillus litorisediminis TaxID=2922713 RepID=UPI001FABB265|nr:helix-turn-helix transcriptional regulator [Bacillus litorisediminis]HWO77491.1 helix-turn-helix transcriptional regulator [Bacillus sp. (in: firmicutes)]